MKPHATGMNIKDPQVHAMALQLPWPDGRDSGELQSDLTDQAGLPC